ncbi:MAG: ribose-5-phosphate isomerase RpiA [Proteobacteria bacterium]|nr:ribose-5-phosphate isomerase RpiA [Pseudomonadota bacterium]
MAEAPTASAERALEFVKDGDTLGLGTGRAAEAFVRALGERVAGGLAVRGVPTSESTATLAQSLGIPLLTLEQAGTLDCTFDGADEVSPQLDLIKGYGAALVREKIVAASSLRLVILVGEEKLVDVLGARGRLPVEVIPFGVALAKRRLEALGCPGELRTGDAGPVVTDNGNHILDARVSKIEDPQALDAALLGIPGVVGTGIFAGMAEAVVVQTATGVRVLERQA